jgi:hypothetical protein
MQKKIRVFKEKLYLDFFVLFRLAKDYTERKQDIGLYLLRT